MKQQLDLDLVMQPPDFSIKAVLTIDALAPLSMVASMPGKYYRSQAAPSDEMLYGLLENALGWHIGESARADIIKRLPRQQGEAARASGVGYSSLLQFHLHFAAVREIPSVLRFDDLWSQHLKGNAFVGGSREYDHRAIPLMDAKASGRVRIEEKGGFRKEAEALTDFAEDDHIHISVLRPYFPQYYVSPTQREYVAPLGPYRFLAMTSAEIAESIGQAIAEPAAPLYLGTSDGWVDVEWSVLP